MRDVTRALLIAQIIQQRAGDEYSPELNTQLVQILTDLDARTGRRDPSKRTTKAPATRAATKGKKGARGR